MGGMGRSQATEAPWEVQVPYLTAGFERSIHSTGPRVPTGHHRLRRQSGRSKDARGGC